MRVVNIDELRPLTAIRLLELWRACRKETEDPLERTLLCNARILAECCFCRGEPAFPDEMAVLGALTGQQMTELLGDSLLYLERKENGQKLSDTAQERVKAVKAVRDFAKFKLNQLRLMDQQDRAKFNQAEADAFRQTAERRQAHQDTITQHMNDLNDTF